jgi:hypothetical protein
MKPGSSEFSPHDDKNMVCSEQIDVEFCKTVFRRFHSSHAQNNSGISFVPYIALFSDSNRM